MNTKERIISMIDEKFKNRAEFERAAGLALQTVNDWERKSQSYYKCIPLIAKILDTSSNYLLCETDDLSHEPFHPIAQAYEKAPQNVKDGIKTLLSPYMVEIAAESHVNREKIV